MFSLTSNKTTVIRIKSDNADCYLTIAAYKVLILQMSSGEFGTHKTRLLEVDGNTYAKIQETEIGLLDVMPMECVDGVEILYWAFYQKGDCNFEVVS